MPAVQKNLSDLAEVANEVLVLYADSRELTDLAELRARRDRLMTILGRVVDDTEEGRVTDEGFQVFSVTWSAVDRALADLAAELRASARPAGGSDG